MADIANAVPDQPQASLPRAIASMVAAFLLGVGLPYWTRTAHNPALAFFTTFSIIFAVFLVALFPRHGFALGWKLAPFPLMLIASLAGTIHTTIVARRAMHADMDAVARLVRRPGGTMALPQGVEAGPFTRNFIEFARQVAKDGTERDRWLDSLGIEQLFDANAVKRDPALLRDCDRFRRARRIVDYTSRQILTHQAEWRAISAQIFMDPVTKQQMLDQQKESEPRARSKVFATAAIEHHRLDTAGAVCTLLGSASWQARNGSHVFADQAASQRFLDYAGQLALDDVAQQQRVAEGLRLVRSTQTAIGDSIH